MATKIKHTQTAKQFRPTNGSYRIVLLNGHDRGDDGAQNDTGDRGDAP